MIVEELLSEFPAVPSIEDYASPEAYIAASMDVARWFMDHADDIRAALVEASIQWVGSAEALEIAAVYGVIVSKAGLWKAATEKGYIDYKADPPGRLLYNRASVISWATNRNLHKAGPKGSRTKK